MASEQRRRGPYHQYYHGDGAAQIPRSTVWRLNQQEDAQRENLEENAESEGSGEHLDYRAVGNNDYILQNDDSNEENDEDRLDDEYLMENDGSYSGEEEDIHWEAVINDEEEDIINNEGEDIINHEGEDADDENNQYFPDHAHHLAGMDPDLFSDETLYEGALMTKAHLIGLLVGYVLKHRVSGTGLQDLLTLLNLVAPGCVPKTKYFLEKNFFTKHGSAEVHYICPNCPAYLGTVIPNECDMCRFDLQNSDCYKDGNFFLVLPLEMQLRELLEEHHTLLRSEARPGTVREHDLDIFFSNQYNISLSFSTDGAPVFKSSKTSIWPVLCYVNELPDLKRKQNVIMHSLWFGKCKPSMCTLFKPFVQEVTELYTNGFAWNCLGNMETSKVAAVLCICDAVGRALVQNFSQFNGLYGCGFCDHEGEVVRKGNGYTRVYVLGEEPIPLRTHLNTVARAEMATELGVPVQGVKGASPLLLLPEFDIVKGVIPDYMHAICLGVVKQFVNLWLDRSYARQPFHISNEDVQTVNSLLCKITPTNEITRRPRSLEDRRFWKANEWRSFLLFYSPVIMKGILRPCYYNHWMLLVYAVHRLFQVAIGGMDLDKAHQSLQKFVVLVPELYGEEHVSYNVHILLHVTESVRNWGPLYLNSAFLFEDFTGFLLKLFKGTQDVASQICKMYSAFKTLQKCSSVLMEDALESVQALYCHLAECTIITKKAEKSCDNNVCVGAPKMEMLNRGILNLIEEEFPGNFITGGDVPFYNRIISKGLVFTTQLYSNSFQRNNSSVFVNDLHGFAVLKKFVLLKPLVCERHGQHACTESLCSSIVCICQKYNIVRDNYIYDNFVHTNIAIDHVKIAESNTFCACFPHNIKNKCILVNTVDSQYLIPIPQLGSG